MTGGQEIEGGMSVPAIVRSLEAEGVKRIVITTDEPEKYANVVLPGGCEVRHRREILAVQRALAKIEGVTVLLHDQACAAELRRERKRGLAPDRPERIVINERVCEGCGDCGEKSSCLSVEPVETEFGRKTRINQTSCNKDYSCLEGDCPSFIAVLPPKGGAPARGEDPLPAAVLPEPDGAVLDRDEVRVRMVGIGGTGVVTVSQVLGMAALLDGRHVGGLDQTGLSQKAGPVVSDVHISRAPIEEGVTPGSISADVLLGFDLIGSATTRSLHVADPERTVAVVSEHVTPTAGMIVSVDAPAPQRDAARAAIDAATRADDNVFLDAHGISERLFGDATPANVLLLGAAWQRGALPVSLGALREAFRLNGVAVDRNLAAFEWGRACVVDPALVRDATGARPRPRPRSARASARSSTPSRRRPASCGACSRSAFPTSPAGAASGRDALRRRAGARAGARERADPRIERGHRGRRPRPVQADRLQGRVRGRAAAPRGARGAAEGRADPHPPASAAAAGDRDGAQAAPRRAGSSPCCACCAMAARLRGTALDPFGRTEVRRVERALPGEYMALVERALAELTPATLGRSRSRSPSCPTSCAATRRSSSRASSASGRAGRSWSSSSPRAPAEPPATAGRSGRRRRPGSRHR